MLPAEKRSPIRTKMTFDEIYSQNADMVLNLAYRMTGREEAARDLTQDVFVKVYEKMDSFREESKISTWIYRITMNRVINYMNREKRIMFFDAFNKEKQADIQQETVPPVWDNNLPVQPDQHLEENEKELIIRKMIDTIPAKYKIPFLLFRYEEMSYKEIADYLQISLSAVETRIHRAKKKLKEKLKPWLDHF